MTEAGGQSQVVEEAEPDEVELVPQWFWFSYVWPDWIERGKFKLMNKKLTVKPTKQKEYLQKLLEAEMQVSWIRMFKCMRAEGVVLLEN